MSYGLETVALRERQETELEAEEGGEYIGRGMKKKKKRKTV